MNAIEWEMSGLHYGYHTFTINTSNGKCLNNKDPHLFVDGNEVL